MNIKVFLTAILLALSTYCFSMENPVLDKPVLDAEHSLSIMQDLNAMYQHITEDHPGISNELDPHFRSTLETSYSAAQELIKSSASLQEQQHVLEQFAKSFKDPHLWVLWNVTSDAPAAAMQKTQPSVEALTITQPAPHVAVITLPTFYFVDDMQKQQLAAIVGAMPDFRHYKSIIFDLRGNRGGNSAYGSYIIKALFGKEYATVHRKAANAQVAVDWKVSEGNREHIKMLCKKYNVKALEAVAEGMQRALNNGEYYYRTPSGSQQPIDLNKVQHDVTAAITVIIDNRNASAALDFIDELKMMKYPVTLIGQTTKADRLYIDVRTVDLPSGLGTFSFPIKVFRNRIRKDSEPYTPDIEIPLDSDPLSYLV